MSYSTYQPSGAVPGGAFPLAAGSLVLALPLAVFYAWLIRQLPALIGFFVCFAFAFTMAGAVKAVCVLAMVRNPRWVGRFGLLLGFCGWYGQWAAWLALQREGGALAPTLFTSALQMALQPSDMFRQLMQLPLWQSGALASGLTAAIWLLELWMLLFFPHYMGKMRAEAVFDEEAGIWAGHTELPDRFRLVAQSDLLQLLSSSASLSSILVAEPDADSPHYSRLRIFRCRGSDPLVSVMTVEVKGNDGKERVIERWPGMYLRVPEAELDALLAGAPAAAAEQADPPELASAIARLKAGDFQGAYEEALPFVAAEDHGLYCDANRICAIVCSESKQWPQALAYWQALFAKEGSAHNALQVATSAVMANEVGQGDAWIARAHTINAASREMPGIAIITTMLSALTAANQPEAALPYLEQLKGFYTQLHVTDPTFLFGHRLPLFHVFLEKSGAIVNAVLGKDEGREWYASMLPHLDERGQAELTAWLDGAGVPA